MSRRFAPAIVPLLLPALCAALAACSPAGPSPAAQSAPPAASGDAQSAAPRSGLSAQSAAPASSNAPSPEPAAPILGDAWATSVEPTEPEGADSLVFHDLRVGEHDSFYRVVVEFTGEGVPGVSQSWADKPLEQGRGRELPVAGSSWLDLVISGTSMPLDDASRADYYSGERNIPIGPLDVREDGTFEDTTHLVIGMDEPRDFQIGFLESPSRVVIDIRK
ncbi:hypothetical protein M3T53_03505 [Actinomyces sp. B33]|uniref:AMIN-like domain-containing (lipo)protein n=1 Tax=Actinomyces sp. B33 TaxID=2942131 RepID=UPI002342353A|nr:hypothetical protein [Actinomyces sp. B33]MDC4232781.1 hypothetical protein [Actinomyces sp. B33]